MQVNKEIRFGLRYVECINKLLINMSLPLIVK